MFRASALSRSLAPTLALAASWSCGTAPVRRVQGGLPWDPSAARATASTLAGRSRGQGCGPGAPREGGEEAAPVADASAEGEAPTQDGPSAETVEGAGYGQADWGLGAMVRIAEIPFGVSQESTVSSFIPMLFYEGEYGFARGIAGGAHLWKDGDAEFNALARLRFFDIPAELQNAIRGDTVDVGLQAGYAVGDFWAQGECMSDSSGRIYLEARLGAYQGLGKLELIPSVNWRWKTREFNDYYFALTSLTGESAGAGWELKPNLLARYHLWSDVYLLGSAGYTLYDPDTSDLDAISTLGQTEVLLGFGFFQNSTGTAFMGVPQGQQGPVREISTPPYLRLAHGLATPSSLADILGFEWEDDEFDNQLTSIFYGHPLTDELFGVPMDVYLTPGFVWHHPSEVQGDSQEYVLAIKLYYTIPWPTSWRIGIAEGVSWISDVTYIERTSLEEDGFEPSRLMNYLDFSFDLNVGDLVRYEPLEKLWLGWSIHHRSSIFESASQFGRIKGGSNYNTIYLQYDIL